MAGNCSFTVARSAILAATLLLAGGSVLVAATNVPPLEIKTQFFYETDSKEIKPLNDGSILKSGQKVGVAFRSQENSFIYIFWKDSTGNMGTLFPNPALTAAIPQVAAGKTYWLPHQDGESWYILDDTPGTEVLYFVASRARNPKLEQLAGSLLAPPAGSQATQPGNQAAGREVERELSIMGFAQHTVPKGVENASFTNKEEIFKNLEGSIRVSGAEALFKVEFKHIGN